MEGKRMFLPEEVLQEAQAMKAKDGKSPEYKRIGASNCKKSDEGIVGGNSEGRNIRRDVV